MMDVKKYKKFIMNYDEYISYNHKFQEFNEIVEKVNEGLIKTLSVDYTIKYVDMYLSKFKLDYDISNNDNSLILSINQFNYIDLIRMKLTTRINGC